MRPARGRANGLSFSNVDSFLVHTAPCVRVEEHKGVPVFSLSSLWSFGFEEASAYGCQVPLSYGPSQVSQVYTPSLSAIRLFASDAHSSRDSRECYTSDEERGEPVCSDSGSSCSEATVSDSEDGKYAPCLGSAAQRHGLRPGASGGGAHRGAPRLLYEFYETASPHVREPLTERVCQLAAKFPGLHTLHSCDLHPSSYIAVAWYPLYALNKVAALRRDLNACFLTFHSLGGPPAAAHSPDAAPAFAQRRQAAGASAAFLPAFAYVPYKMQGRLWAEEGRSGSVHAAMVDAAMRLHEGVKSKHSDLDFFLQNSPGQRREASHF